MLPDADWMQLIRKALEYEPEKPILCGRAARWLAALYGWSAQAKGSSGNVM